MLIEVCLCRRHSFQRQREFRRRSGLEHSCCRSIRLYGLKLYPLLWKPQPNYRSLGSWKRGSRLGRLGWLSLGVMGELDAWVSWKLVDGIRCRSI